MRKKVGHSGLSKGEKKLALIMTLLNVCVVMFVIALIVLSYILYS